MMHFQCKLLQFSIQLQLVATCLSDSIVYSIFSQCVCTYRVSFDITGRQESLSLKRRIRCCIISEDQK